MEFDVIRENELQLLTYLADTIAMLVRQQTTNFNGYKLLYYSKFNMQNKRLLLVVVDNNQAGHHINPYVAIVGILPSEALFILLL